MHQCLVVPAQLFPQALEGIQPTAPDPADPVIAVAAAVAESPCGLVWAQPSRAAKPVCSSGWHAVASTWRGSANTPAREVASHGPCPRPVLEQVRMAPGPAYPLVHQLALRAACRMPHAGQAIRTSDDHHEIDSPLGRAQLDLVHLPRIGTASRQLQPSVADLVTQR